MRIIFAAFGAIIMSASLSMAQSGDQLKPSAMKQAGELLASKGSLTEAQKKLDTQLLKVIPPQSLSDQARKLLDVEAGKTQVSKVDVDIALTGAKDISALIVQSGGEVLDNHPNELTLRARIPSDQLETVAGSPDVRSIATADQPYLKKFELKSSTLGSQSSPALRRRHSARRGPGQNAIFRRRNWRHDLRYIGWRCTSR